MKQEFVLSADAGGTFLDLVLVDQAGSVTVGKALHTPDKPEVGILQAIAAVAAPLKLSAAELLQRCRLVFHGTTVTTNGIIEHKGVKTALLCTRGFEDTVYIGRVKARTEGLDQYQLTHYTRMDRAEPIVTVQMTRGVSQRMDAEGNELQALDEEEVASAARELVALGAQALAISFLHSYVNPAHERQAASVLKKLFPDLHVVLGSDISPVIGEFERTNTAVVNAFLNPLLARHLSNLDRVLNDNGYKDDVLIMQSIGGVAPSAKVRNESVMTLLSGPVGGIVGAQKIGSLIGEPNLITTDMGGTSFDVGVVVGGKPQYSTQATIHRQVLAVPSVDIETIGAGGGSKVWLDENLNIQVGPESVGARPGPACYGNGGTVPTVTDADVVLGFLDPASFSLGGRPANRELAVGAFEQLGARIDLSAIELADAVRQIVDNRMADLVRKATVERGHDPSDFVILAYGGSGPAHCAAYGAEIGAKKIVIPPYASVFSAYGIANSDIKHTVVRSAMVRGTRAQLASGACLAALNRVLGDLLDEVAGGSPPAGRHTVNVSADIRYKGQTTEIAVPVTEAQPLDDAAVHALLRRFERTYEMNYGSGAASPSSPLEVVNLRAEVVVPVGGHSDPAPLPTSSKRASDARKGDRPVYWGSAAGWVDTPVYAFERLETGHVVEGPCVIELFRTSVPVLKGQTASVDPYRNLTIDNPREGTTP